MYIPYSELLAALGKAEAEAMNAEKEANKIALGSKKADKKKLADAYDHTAQRWKAAFWVAQLALKAKEQA